MSDLQALFDQAIALHQRGALEDAERLYQRVLLMEPASFAPRHMLGVVRYQQGRYPQAIELISDALKRNPNVAAAWVNLGNVQSVAGAPEEAIASYRKALALAPGDSQILDALVTILWNQGRGDEAQACLDALLATQPDDIALRHHRGNMLRQL